MALHEKLIPLSESSPLGGGLPFPLSGLAASTFGKIRVAKGGNLRCENSTINGDLIARGANFVQLTNCTVTGKVSVLNGGFFGLFESSILEGDLTLRGNLDIDLFDSEVRGNAVCARNGDPDTAGMTYLGTNKGCLV